MLAKGKVSVLWKIYKELMIMGGMSIEEVASVISTDQLFQLARLYKALVRNRGMSIEEVAAAVDINLNILPDMERELDQTCKALARKQVELDSLKEEEKRWRNRIVTLPPSSYRYVENRENPATNTFPYHSYPTSTPSSLPYWHREILTHRTDIKREYKIKSGKQLHVQMKVFFIYKEEPAAFL